MYDFQKGRIKYLKGGKYPHCHTIFIDDKVRALIDPACSADKLKAIQSEKPVDIVINSHCHEDHFLYNHLFPEAKLWVPALEAELYRDINNLVGIWTYSEPNNEEYKEKIKKYLVQEAHYQEREPDRLLKDEEIVEFGETRMKTLHMPGHSQGHMCFHFPQERIIFTADLDLVKAGPYYGDHRSDVDDIINALERLAKIDVDTYLTAHGKIGIYEGNPEYVKQYLDTIYQREKRLLEFLSKAPRTLQEITDQGIIYGKREVAGAWDLTVSEQHMMEKHLIRLERLKKVRYDCGFYIILS